MSADPADVVRRLVAAFNAFDVDTVIELCAPDVVVEENPSFPDASTFRGHDGVRDMLRRWAEAFDELHTEIDELQVDGEEVVLVGSYEGRGRTTGAPAAMQHQRAVYRVRDGQIVYARFGGGA